MKISFTSDSLPEWVDTGKLGVEILFDDITYFHMKNALRIVKEAPKNSDLEKLREVILGDNAPKFGNENKIDFPELNPSQNDAVQHILNAQELAIVHGPPGTGKTTTLVRAIEQSYKRGEKLIVCAPSNAAVDLLAKKLNEKSLPVIRVGNLAKIDDELMPLTLEGQLKSHADFKLFKDYKKKAQELRRMAGTYKRSFGKAEREQRTLLYKEARSIMADAIKIEESIVKDLVSRKNIICTTLVGSMNYYLKEQGFDTVFIDESAQGLEAACWIPITKSKKVVLSGDIFQLPPTVKNISIQKELEVSMMEYCMNYGKPSSLLNTQYRMNDAIMQFSNQYFYENKLMSFEGIAHHTIENLPVFTFVDTAGCSFDEEVSLENASTFNKGEAELVLKILERYPEIEKVSCGVISPYREQVGLLKKLTEGKTVTVNTIDSFQGQERDVIIISLVRSNEKSQIGFLKDYRRLNVALTRAKKCLVVIGDSATISKDSFFNTFMDYAEKIGGYTTAWEYMY